MELPWHDDINLLGAETRIVWDDRSIPWLLIPGSLHRQDISTYAVDYTESTALYLPEGKISTITIISVMNIDRKCKYNFDGFVQDCSNSIANALELLQSCTKPSISCFLE